MTRIQVQNDQYSLKIEDRPTIAYFKKVLQAYDLKFEMVNAQLSLQMEKLDRTQADQDREIADLGTELTMRGRELDLKVEKEDLTELWLHFDRFSLYEDLKSLHSKVIPEIAKFE